MTTALSLAVVVQEAVKALHAYDEATDVSQVKVHRTRVQLCLTSAKHYYSLLSSVWLQPYTNLTLTFRNLASYIQVKVKVKFSHNRPVQAQRVLGS